MRMSKILPSIPWKVWHFMLSSVSGCGILGIDVLLLGYFCWSINQLDITICPVEWLNHAEGRPPLLPPPPLRRAWTARPQKRGCPRTKTKCVRMEVGPSITPTSSHGRYSSLRRSCWLFQSSVTWIQMKKAETKYFHLAVKNQQLYHNLGWGTTLIPPTVCSSISNWFNPWLNIIQGTSRFHSIRY